MYKYGYFLTALCTSTSKVIKQLLRVILLHHCNSTHWYSRNIVRHILCLPTLSVTMEATVNDEQA